jgi:hypothetical protein
MSRLSTFTIFLEQLMVAIVIITQDRKEQLRKTLDSFKKYNPKNFFVVIIDDKMNDCKGLPKYKFKVHVLTLTEADECANYYTTAFNYGLGITTALKPDIVIMQQGEVLHYNDILGMAETVTESQYISFGCYSLGQNEIVETTAINNVKASYNGESAWYNHPVHRPMGYPFCAALTLANIKKLNGFDERFHEGIGYEDDYFTHQVRCLGLEIIITENPYTYHQWHPSPERDPARWSKNVAKYNELTPLNEFRAVHILTPDL